MADESHLYLDANIELARALRRSPMPPQRLPRPGDPGLPPPTPPPYPLQPNGLPDLSGVPTFGEQGFAELARKVGPQMAMDMLGIAAPGIGKVITAAPKTAATLA